MAVDYGYVYVARVAMGASDAQTLRAIVEAESYDGPSLIIAYSHCIAHGINMAKGMDQQRMAVESGYWPLYRYDPRHAHAGEHPFHLDSRAPKLPVSEFMAREARFAMLGRAQPAMAAELAELAQHDVDERRHVYEQMAEIEHEPAAEEEAET
jgi:pyruvate-ferredoxin/flavodoxin oxidoreductase